MGEHTRACHKQKYTMMIQSHFAIYTFNVISIYLYGRFCSQLCILLVTNLSYNFSYVTQIEFTFSRFVYLLLVFFDALEAIELSSDNKKNIG